MGKLYLFTLSSYAYQNVSFYWLAFLTLSLLAVSVYASGWCPSLRLSVPSIDSLRRLPAIGRYLPVPESSSGQRFTLRSEGRGPTQTCVAMVLFVTGILAEFMSGKPGDIPRFVDEMMKSSGEDESAAEGTRDCRPKSETAAAASHGQPLIEPRPKTDFARASNASQQRGEICEDLAGTKESLKPATASRFTTSTPDPMSRISRPVSEQKPLDVGSKDENSRPPRMTINRETEQLIEELKRQYSMPVFINDGTQFFMDDTNERAGSSAAVDSPPQKLEQCKQIFSLLAT